MQPDDTILYKSPQARRSLGNEYRIYCDRIELRCRVPFVAKTFVIRKEDIVSIDVFAPPVVRTSMWALKLDFADLYEHVGITRKSGFFKQLRFTPENPQQFVEKVCECFRI